MAMTGDEVGSFVVFLIIWLLLCFFFIQLFRKALKVVHHAEVMIVERWGRYRDTLKPGWHLLVPYMDTPRTISWRYMDVRPLRTEAEVVHKETDRIDMREHVIDFGKQHVITRDTVSIEIDALVYYQITDPELAVFKIQNLPDAIELLTQTTLRNIIAHMTLDDTFSNRDTINTELKGEVGPDAERWGVTITRVEVMNILPPYDIKNAMEYQIQQERERRSTVLQADGERESAVIRSRGDAAKMVLEADGVKTSRINVARGEAKGKLLKAEAEATAIKVLKEAINASKHCKVRATDYLIAVQYIVALYQLAQAKRSSRVVLVPTESLDSMNAMLKGTPGFVQPVRRA